MSYRILTGDALTTLKGLKAGSFDGCFCDPPYGLSSTEKRNVRRMSPRASSRATASGFMGMAWDATTPDAELWAEVLRVLKPGTPMLVFGGTRTFHRLVCAIEDAGFLIADTICWVYSQGFPKGKSQLKPAWEPITLAWKKGTRQPLAIDASRIQSIDTGRWPANLILDPAAGELLDTQSGRLASGEYPSTRNTDKFRGIYQPFKGTPTESKRGENAGGASRFFYCAKASKKERGAGNTHPTVKPLKLCEYLARLILPPTPNAKLLVPFSGSGSEMLAARRAGWKHITGIEQEASYTAIAESRLTLTA